MEAKLKALKVPELKQILTRAGVSIPTKANKADLIAKIISEPAATAVANGEDPSNANGNAVAAASIPEKAVSSSTSDQKLQELLAPPEEFDWDTTDVQPTTTTTKPVSSTEKASAPAAAIQPTSLPTTAATETQTSVPPDVTATTTANPSTTTTTTATTTTAAPAEDEELERRKARAARFGIPLVESKPAKQNQRPKQQTQVKAVKASNAVNGKAVKSSTGNAPSTDAQLKARSERFGTKNGAVSKVAGQKRPAEEVVDPEELEKRRKRAERFGLPTSA